MNNGIIKKLLLSLYHFFCFFALTAFLVTCCMVLFLNTMSNEMGVLLTEENIKTAAIITFGNVVLLSVCFTLIDKIRRKLTVERPVKKITEAAQKISKGDYSVRIPPLGHLSKANGLDEIVDCFNKMAMELSGVESLQSDFISNVSHELKTPLSVMQNYGTLLACPELSEEERMYYAHAVHDASKNLSLLVTNILRLSKLENQQIYPSITEYDLSEQLSDCLLGFEQIWEEKEIDIDTDIDGDVFIKADPELLSLVWNNLFSNALKFTDRGGRVTVALRKENGLAVITVSDTGCGISSEEGRYIFDKFYQADSSRATKGSGLGLALVKRVMRITGGEISVSSKVGKGSTFTVKIEAK